jgi:hypothetical protein
MCNRLSDVDRCHSTVQEHVSLLTWVKFNGMTIGQYKITINSFVILIAAATKMVKRYGAGSKLHIHLRSVAWQPKMTAQLHAWGPYGVGLNNQIYASATFTLRQFYSSIREVGEAWRPFGCCALKETTPVTHVVGTQSTDWLTETHTRLCFVSFFR